MYCKYCGRQIEDDSKFCEFCGNLVQHTNKVTPADREPDIPAPIGDPIFKEIVFDQQKQTVADPPQSTASDPVPEPVSDPEEAEQEQLPEKKPVNKGLIAGLIAGGIALVGVIVLIVVLCTRPKIMEVETAKYIDFKVSGYDGYGIATCEMDWDGLEVAAFGEYPKGNDSKTRAKQTEYKEKALVLHSAVTLEFTERKNLSVGDKLTASITVNKNVEKELGIEFIGKNTVEYIVKESDLNGSSELDIVKEFVNVSFDGRSGTAQAVIATPERDKAYTFTTYDGTEYTIAASVKDENKICLTFTNTEDKTYETIDIECTAEPAKDLKNGDKVKVKLGMDAKDQLMSAYGLTLSEKTAEFEVKDLNTLVTKVSEVEKATVTGWVSKYSPMLEKYVLANWDSAIHGGNKITTKVKEFKDVTLVKKIVACGDTDNAMYLIYTASVFDDGIALDNSGFPQTYYFAVCLRDLELDSKHKLLTDQIQLPSAKSADSFLGAYASYDEILEEISLKYSSIDEK